MNFFKKVSVLILDVKLGKILQPTRTLHGVVAVKVTVPVPGLSTLPR